MSEGGREGGREGRGGEGRGEEGGREGFTLLCIVDIQGFKLLTSHVTAECLQLILAVLKPKQQVSEVMEKEDKEEADEADSSDGSESEAGGEDASDSEGSDDEEGEGSDEEQEVGVVDPAFAESVRRALGAAAAVASDQEVGVSRPLAPAPPPSHDTPFPY